MPCVNHPANEVQSYCQNCGKPLCKSCVRTTALGQIVCAECQAAGIPDPAAIPTGGANAGPGQPYWQGGGIPPFYPVPSPGAPNPAAAAMLGLIPGVGAMYNGQLFKGLIHVVIFAVLVSITDHYPIFGLFIAAWVLYQSFEAFHTAKARRDGLPIPDPFGLNELGNWLNLGSFGRNAGPNPNPNAGTPPLPGVPPAPPSGYAPYAAPVYDPVNPAVGSAGTEPPVYTAPYTSTYTSSWSDPGNPNNPANPVGANPAGAPQPPYAETYAGVNPDPYAPYGQGYPPGFIPPIPPVAPIPPYGWRRREPVWAIVLIVLGVIFLLQSLGVVSHIFHYAWPVLLIGFGVWLIVSRLGYSQGGSK